MTKAEKNILELNPKVLSLFDSEISQAIPNSCKDLRLRQISALTAMELNSLWHSRLPETKLINLLRNKEAAFFGAEFNNRWFAVGIWTSPVSRFHNNKDWIELRRFAIGPNAPKNSGSYLLSLMLKEIKILFPHLKRAISYQDSSIHDGTIYKAANWTKDSETIYKPGWNSRPRNPEQATGNKIRWSFNFNRKD